MTPRQTWPERLRAAAVLADTHPGITDLVVYPRSDRIVVRCATDDDAVTIGTSLGAVLIEVAHTAEHQWLRCDGAVFRTFPVEVTGPFEAKRPLDAPKAVPA